MPSTASDDLLNAADLADRIGVRPSTVIHWHAIGRIPGRKLTSKVPRFSLPAVLAALESNTRSEGASR